MKKRVDGHTPGIDRRHARRRYDYQSFGRLLLNLVQKGSFPGACFAGQENVFVRVTHIIESKFELWIGLEGHVALSWGVAWLNDIRMYDKAQIDTSHSLQLNQYFLFKSP